MFSNLLQINPQQEEIRIITFLKEIFQKQNIDKAIIGISGGIDSATSLTLLSKALPKENILALHLPYFNEVDKDIPVIEEALGIRITTVSIQHTADEMMKRLEVPQDDKVRRGNIMARIRMIMLFDWAKKNNALVVGTENRSEYHLGYFTRYGDEGSDIEPLQHLYKTQVFELAKSIGVPQSVIDKPPSANLWQDQSDEDEFGFTYQEADPVLFLFYDKKNPLWEIENMLPGAVKVIDFAEKSQFKHKVPYHL
jgi:NAD+ synthase